MSVLYPFLGTNDTQPGPTRRLALSIPVKPIGKPLAIVGQDFDYLERSFSDQTVKERASRTLAFPLLGTSKNQFRQLFDVPCGTCSIGG